MTAPLPKDELIIEELARIFRRISVANGFLTDAGATVITEETRDIPTDAACIEVLDPLSEGEQQSVSQHNAQLRILARVTVPADIPTARRDVRRAIVDMRRALADRSQHNFPVGMRDLRVGSRRILPREDGSAFIEGELDISASYLESHKEHLT